MKTIPIARIYFVCSLRSGVIRALKAYKNRVAEN
jgi:hypothetical protein